MADRRFFSQMPNLIDDADLSVYEFRLYAHIARVCGADGSCRQGIRLLSEWLNFSPSGVFKAKKKLIEKGLITFREIKTPNGDGHEIKLVDLWNLNAQIYDKDSKISVPKSPNATQRTAIQAARRFESFKSQNRNTPLPKDFKLTKKLRDWAEKNVSGVDVELEFDLFINANLAGGNKSRNWDSFFKKWLRDAAIYKY